jgi:hypothetical protein
MRIEHTVSREGHSLKCVVTDHPHGWAVRHEKDSVVIHDVVHRDWHRVERDLMLFDLRAGDSHAA